MQSTKFTGSAGYLEAIGSDSTISSSSAISSATNSATTLVAAQSDSIVATSSASNGLETSAPSSPSQRTSTIIEEEDDVSNSLCLPWRGHSVQCTKSGWKKIAKYSYLIAAMAFGGAVGVLQKVSDPFEEWISGVEEGLLNFMLNGTYWPILLTLFVITVLKSFGMKDVLGLRTASVVLLSVKIMGESCPIGWIILVCMMLSGVFSSISKLIEYRVIGRELQVIYGIPVNIAFFYFRRGLSYFTCLRKREHWLRGLDPKWSFEISEKSRNDLSMDIITNINAVLSLYHTCSTKRRTPQSSPISSTENALAPHCEESNELDVSRTRNSNPTPRTGCRLWLWRSLLFCVAVVWTSCVEWIQPITELFLYLHNWRLKPLNVVVIICAEFMDFDKIVETSYLIQGVIDGDIVNAKIKSVLAKGYFWAMGYLLIMPPTLIFAYVYHQEFIAPTQKKKEIEVLNVGEVIREGNESKGSGSADTKESVEEETECAEDMSYSTDIHQNQKETANPQSTMSQ